MEGVSPYVSHSAFKRLISKTNPRERLKLFKEYVEAVSLATIEEETTVATAPPVLEYLGGGEQEQEKENTMTMTLDLQQMDFFRDALRTKKDEKLEALRKQFGLTDDTTPQSEQELVDRITSGKFILDENSKDLYQYSLGNIIRGITWRDPAIKKDQAGFDAAKKTLLAAYEQAEFAIMTDPSKGADAVNTFAAA